MAGCSMYIGPKLALNSLKSFQPTENRLFEKGCFEMDEYLQRILQREKTTAGNGLHLKASSKNDI